MANIGTAGNTPYQTRVLKMATGNGYLVKFNSAVGFAQLKTRADCLIQPFYTADGGTDPSAPGSSPAVVSAGDTSEYLELLAGEVELFGVDASVDPKSTQADQISGFLVWALGNGNLVLSGH